jgi:L-rhamnose 1-dehydrogenase
VLLDNKVVIVTGASRGIGRAIAVACAKEGAHVVLNYWGDNDRSYGRLSAVEEVVDEIETLGRRVIAVEGNVAQRETGLELVKQAVDAFGHVDVLASNAGICPFHTFLDMPASVYEATVGVNLNGAFYVTQAVANQMKLQGTGGAIVATSSISALVGGAMQTHYTPTKAGVHSLMPGTIATDLNAEDLADTEKRVYFEKRIPLGRLGEPDDVAQCVTFLASDRARYVTGASLLVDGGLFVNLQ